MRDADTISRPGVITYTGPMSSTDPDVRLMLRYRDGDLAAFEALYRRQKDGLYRYLLRLCPDEATAEDLFQEAWGKLIAARRRYRATARFSTYLYRIAHNCFIDHCRRQHGRPTAHQAIDGELAPADDDPLRESDRLLARATLDRLLRELPQEQRDAFLLHEEGGLTIAEIAEVTGVGAETTKSRLRYAYRKLRAGFTALAPEGGADRD